jgi:type IV pilus assembly protein PilY1
MNFPVSGERIVASPMVFDDKVVFGTGIPQVSEKCIPGGKGWIMGLNPFTGSITTNNSSYLESKYSFIDIKKDGKSTDDDKIDFTTGKEFMSGYEKEGIPTELTYVTSVNKIVMPTGASTSALDIGKVISQREANYMAVYTGNPKFNTNAYGKKIPAIVIYKSMPKPASTGKGQLYVGTIGSTAIDPETFLTRFAGIKVETSTWREIK